MTGLLALLLTIAVVLAATYLPGYAAARILRASPLLALALAPALGAAVAGASAIVAPLLSLRWSLLPFLLGAAVLLAVAAGLRRLGAVLPATVLDGPAAPRGALPLLPLWLTGAVAVTVVPIAVRAGRVDAVLERWDALYHLSALARIRETGNASSLAVGAVSNSAGTPTAYPAGFHALASLVPGVEIPVMLNGAVLTLAVVPWVLGTGLLARAVFPRIPWAPGAAATAAALIPAAPLDEWIHLSAIPNVAGAAAVPGVLAAAAALWGALLPRLGGRADLPSAADAPRASGTGTTGSGTSAPGAPVPLLRALIASLGVLGVAGIGLALLHPNTAVTVLLLLVALTGVTVAPSLRERPALLAVPVLLLLPYLVMTYSPLGGHVTEFQGGLQVSPLTALGEIVLGLHTVWPMAFGVVLALVWWPGLVRAARGASTRWLVGAFVVIAVLYYDAAVDSTANLSALYYRGQDRIAMTLAMLCAVLVVPGLQRLGEARRARRPAARDESTEETTAGDRADGDRADGDTADGAAPFPGLGRPLVVGLVLLAVLAAGTTIPARLDDAAKNLVADYPGRGRFLQADERALFEQHAPQMDPDGVILASPYSGAAHMYALYGLSVRLPVLGMSYSDEDRDLLYATETAGSDPAACALLREHDIRYVYQEWRPYQHHKTSDSVNLAGDDLGVELFRTDHSRMIEVTCDPS
jgi:hypothetical protein